VLLGVFRPREPTAGCPGNPAHRPDDPAPRRAQQVVRGPWCPRCRALRPVGHEARGPATFASCPTMPSQRGRACLTSRATSPSDWITRGGARDLRWPGMAKLDRSTPSCNVTSPCCRPRDAHRGVQHLRPGISLIDGLTLFSSPLRRNRQGLRRTGRTTRMSTQIDMVPVKPTHRNRRRARRRPPPGHRSGSGCW